MKKEIYLVDDDPIYRLIASKTISFIDDSLPIMMYENGQVAIDNLKTITNQNKKIIFLDINMPVMNGWGFLQAFEKSNLMLDKNLEIYIVSSSIDERDILKSKEFGSVKKFLHKPLEKEELKAIICEN